ncbi:MAG: Flp pilus assembly complex ATPase component TadA [Gemmatimonadota bacterium]|nr:Flp pilus assembly complex ATPase component TadA [Gemmatimonadota bacterium]
MATAVRDPWPQRVLDAAREPLPEERSARLAALARRLGIGVADLAAASPAARSLVPERWARQFRVVPLDATDHEIVLATADPLDLECERTLAFATGRQVRFALAEPAAVLDAVNRVYLDGAASPAAPNLTHEVQMLTVDQEVAPPMAGDEDGASVTRLVDELLADGVAVGASDIHIEPEERGIAVRHRIDGVLRGVRTLPLGIARPLVSRIKIVSGLDIADRLRPQDGRARVAVNGAAVDLRVSTLPASRGEKVVIRILDRRSALRSLDAMGFRAEERARIDALLDCREGLILVTGPTGSGKTTTLYAALQRLQQRSLNIVTVEDPIEYRIPGIVQVQVHERAGLTFASALRSIMRQDPDVLLVGEIRDRETAEIAIQASLTGHLVLSTLHTNDAASAVTRLADFGVAPYKIATAVKGVLAQRLVRRLCECARREPGPLAVAERVPCPRCHGEGYRGRLAIVEVLVASAEFERRVADGAPTERLAECARRGGMRSLWESGMAHVGDGATSLDELRRVAAPPSAGKLRVAAAAPAAPDSNPVAVSRSPITLDVGTVEVYVIHPHPDGWRVLLLQRTDETIRPGSWEVVTGSIDGDERPEEAAVREAREETGLDVSRLYCVAVQPFYLPRRASLQLAVIFAAFVDDPDGVVLSDEHQQFAWLDVDRARERFTWPRSQRTIGDIVHLLSPANLGRVEDVLRVR